MDPNPLPAGAQFTIRHGRQEAVIVELGAGLRAFSVDGFDVIDGYEAEEMCTMARGQLLIPWPNRLANGRYRFNGEDHQVPITEHGMKQNALHGLVRWVPWRALEQNQSKIVLGYRHFPEPGYPFHLDLKVRYELVATGLEVEFHATNPGGHRLPLAMGQHPYIRAGEGLIDDSILHAPAATYIEVDERQLPVDVRSVERTGFDFREPRRLGETILDYSFGDFERDSAGRAQISLAG
ncbi:MAG TPA: aldose epimerase, partial [Candidatus Dormibacteraeota bacterium]|nr:aldose epimerase [Candidatus Dormibacteraeota bacterium]